MQKLELQWKEFNVDLEAIEAKFRADHASYVGNQASDKLELYFNDDVTQEELDAIQAYWEAIDEESSEATGYTQKQALAAIKTQVKNIHEFSNNLLVQFNAENIALGITQDNKTEDVLDIMAPVLVALQSGSPTVAIKRIKQIDPQSYDAKYITAARMLAYVNKVEAFLGLPLSEDLQ